MYVYQAKSLLAAEMVLGEEGREHSAQQAALIQRVLVALHIIIIIGNSVEKAGGERRA